MLYLDFINVVLLVRQAGVWTKILPFVWLSRDKEQDTTVLAVPSNKILCSEPS